MMWPDIFRMKSKLRGSDSAFAWGFEEGGTAPPPEGRKISNTLLNFSKEKFKFYENAAKLLKSFYFF